MSLCGPGFVRAGVVEAENRPHGELELDGVVTQEEYGPTSQLTPRIEEWAAEFAPSGGVDEFSGMVRVAHDGRHLFVGICVRDDVEYEVGDHSWRPRKAPEPGPSTSAWPWFGDMAEILVHSVPEWKNRDVFKSPQSRDGWQIVFNPHFSTERGPTEAGLNPHSPNMPEEGWHQIAKWTRSGAMRSMYRRDDAGWTLECAIDLEECLPAEVPASLDAGRPVEIGFNVAVGDVDHEADGTGYFANMRHENWWAGKKDPGGRKKWGKLILLPPSHVSQ